MKRWFKEWWWNRKMNTTVRVPMWVIHVITDVHMKKIEDDIHFSLTMGAIPNGWDHERYVKAMFELRRIFVRKAFNK